MLTNKFDNLTVLNMKRNKDNSISWIVKEKKVYVKRDERM